VKTKAAPLPAKATWPASAVSATSAISLRRGALTTQVPATMSPTLRRSRLKSGKKTKIEHQAMPSRSSQASTWLPWLIRKVSGMKTSSSRMALRAKMASAVSRPPFRAATRKPNARFPGVAALGVSSNRMK
jgi:hypothetical protein